MTDQLRASTFAGAPALTVVAADLHVAGGPTLDLRRLASDDEARPTLALLIVAPTGKWHPSRAASRPHATGSRLSHPARLARAGVARLGCARDALGTRSSRSGYAATDGGSKTHVSGSPRVSRARRRPDRAWHRTSSDRRRRCRAVCGHGTRRARRHRARDGALAPRQHKSGPIARPGHWALAATQHRSRAAGRLPGCDRR